MKDAHTELTKQVEAATREWSVEASRRLAMGKPALEGPFVRQVAAIGQAIAGPDLRTGDEAAE